MKIFLPIIFLFFLVAFNTEAQRYQSISSGGWTSQATWQRAPTCPPPSGWGTIEDTNHPIIPPIDSSWPDCAIDVIISHSVARSDAATFSQKFRTLKISTGGKLVFTTDHTISVSNNSFGGVEFIIDGGEIEAYNLQITNTGKLKIINGGKLKLRNNLTTAGNLSSIEVDASSTLEIGNQLKLTGSNSKVNIYGTVTSKSIVNTGNASNVLNLGSGSNTKTGFVHILDGSIANFSGKTLIESEFQISGSASSHVDKSANLIVNGALSLLGSSKLEIDGSSILNGNVSLAGSSQLKISGASTINSNVTLTGSSNLGVIMDGDVVITGNLIKPQWNGGISVKNKGQLVICSSSSGYGEDSGSYPPTSYANMNIDPSPAFYGGCRIMPVELASFTAAFDGIRRQSNLAWSTAKEWQNSHFEIERSINTASSWEMIGTIDGNGFSDSKIDYSFADAQLPATGGRVFYRIKQVNFDETASYSAIQAVQVGPLAGQFTWAAYPNPTDGTNLQLVVKNQSIQDAPIHVTLSSVMGQQELVRGNSLAEINESLKTALAQKVSGVYLIKVLWGENVETLRVIKN